MYVTELEFHKTNSMKPDIFIAKIQNVVLNHSYVMSWDSYMKYTIASSYKVKAGS